MKQGVFLNLKDGSSDATIDIIGVIGWDIWGERLKTLIAQLPDTVNRVFFDIYSPGGDVWEGNAMVNMIAGIKAETIARIQVAASMATVLALACDKRTMAANGRFLVHNPWTATAGDAEEFEKRAKELREAQNEILDFYVLRTGADREQLEKLMADERWMRAPETQEFGFIDDIIDPFDSAAYTDLKAELIEAGKLPQAIVEIDDEENVEVNQESESENENEEGSENENTGSNDSEESCSDQDEGGEGSETDGGAGSESENQSENESGDESESESESETESESVETETEQESESESESETEQETEARIRSEITEIIRAEALSAASEKIASLKAEKEKLEKLTRKLQSEKDRAEAKAESLEKTLKETNDRLNKLISGGLAFSPSVTTWAEALEKCGGDYAKARKAYPDAYNEYMKNNR